MHRNETYGDCPICGKTFKYRHTYVRHLKDHSSGPKTHKCSFCDYATNRLGNLRLHKAKMHKDLYEEELKQDILGKLDQVSQGNVKGAFRVTGL